MVTITNSNLRANIFETLYDSIKAENLLSGEVTVTASYVDDDTKLPQIVINPADVGEDSYSFDRTYGSKTILVIIDIYTNKKKHLDQITDGLYVVIKDLGAQGISLVSWNESTAFESPNNQKVHLKSVSVEFRR